MFGNKLRSWMEAVRPRKKQHRKDKKKKHANTTESNTNWHQDLPNPSPNENPGVVRKEPIRKIANVVHNNTPTSQAATSSRYSANNLSSPESAYSTGYSTDGTSPGAPPDYYINIRTGVKYFATDPSEHKPPEQCLRVNNPPISRPAITITSSIVQEKKQSRIPMQQQEGAPPRLAPPCANEAILKTPIARVNVCPSPVLTSPRQRNRIRTNPWLPGNTPSPIQARQDTRLATDSPTLRRFLTPSSIRKPSLSSSSSCSSLSGSLQWGQPKVDSEEDDCTLNEMMGKYDESYIYEKETDILSDSDPTDCDDDTADIDTGQDGGDEDDPFEGEFDFIDNGSYLEVDLRDELNTGHCSYYSFEGQRKASKRRTVRRSNKECKSKTKRSTSSKKKHKEVPNNTLNGSRSAGATPLSVRRTKHSYSAVSKLAFEDCLKKRSNSVSFSRDPIATIDKRDKEADRKYKELIVEAEYILRNMKTNALSPRRLPGPANKRVEILRSAECAKPEAFLKNRLEELKMPSSNFSPRFSPKRNHITNFMIHNSPVLMRRNEEKPTSPLVGGRRIDSQQNRTASVRRSPRRSPKYRKKNNKLTPKMNDSSSSSDLEKEKAPFPFNLGCPQSEPVRRKVYSGRMKAVAFHLDYENKACNNESLRRQEHENSAENLRQQVLLNTITNLKRSLEDQSASLKQVYRSSHNIRL